MHRNFSPKIIVTVLADLEFHYGRLVLGRPCAELTREDGLSYSEKTCDDHRLFGSTPSEPGEQQHEGVLLIITPRQQWRGGTDDLTLPNQ